MKAKGTIAAALVLSSLFYLPGRGAAGDGRETEAAWTPDLGLHSLREIGTALHEKEAHPLILVRRKDPADQDGEQRTVETCAAYLSAINDDFYPANNYEEAMASEYIAKCFSLQFLEQVNPAAHIGVIRKWPKGMLWSLPPLMCPEVDCDASKEDAWEAALKKATPWVKWDRKLRIEAANGTMVGLQDGSDWSIGLTLLVQSGSRAGESKTTIEQRFGILACVSIPKGTYHECEFHVVARDGTKLREVYVRP